MEIVPGLHWVERIWDTKVYLWIEAGRVTVVDAAMPGHAGAVWSYLARLGLPPQAVADIWLTHGDIDHMGSAAALKAGSGARLVAHRADVGLVEGSAQRALGPVPFRPVVQHVANWAIAHLPRYCPAVVDCPVEDGDRLDGWLVVHVPGHTPGSVCYYHPQHRIALVGDAITHRRGRLNAPPPSLSSDPAQAAASIARIAALNLEVCGFGHGPPLRTGASERVRALAEALHCRGG